MCEDCPTGWCDMDNISNEYNNIGDINVIKIHSDLLNNTDDDNNIGPCQIYFKLIDLLSKGLTINDLSVGLINKYNNSYGAEKGLLLVIVLVHIYIGLTKKNRENRESVSEYQDIKLKIQENWEKYINSLIGDS